MNRWGRLVADKNNDDEDLMSDFKDLFDDEQAGEPDQALSLDASVASTDSEFDELDSLLDDFPGPDTLSAHEDAADSELDISVDDGDTEEAVSNMADEPAFSTADDDELWGADELAADEMEKKSNTTNDTASSVADDDELRGLDELAADELDLAVGHEQQDLELDAQDDGPAFAATARNPAGEATPASSAAPSSMNKANSGMGMGRLVALVLVLSMLGGGLGALGVPMLLGALQAPQESVSMGGVEGSDSLAVERLRRDILSLASRVNELAVIIEGPISHLRQSNEEALADIQQRLERLEARPVASAARPAASAPVSQASKPITTTASQAGAWSINLISLSNEKDARSEMERLRKQGVRVEMREAEHQGRTWYRLQVPGFESREGAKAYITTIEQQTGIANAWVSRD